MKKLLMFFALVLFTLSINAVPAKRGIVRTLTLQNGKTVQATLVGDEFGHFLRGTDGKAYRQDPATGYYVEINAQDAIAKAKAKRAKSNARRVQRLKSIPNKVGSIGNITGEKKGLIILVQYKNGSFSASNADFQKIANQQNYSSGNYKGSMYDYFKAQSDGQFLLSFDVVGPYEVSKVASYYGSNDSEGNDQHPAEMVIEALKLANADVNYADYDWDGDGEVEQVYVVYEGKGEADGGADNTIWPHEWELSSAAGYGDGSGAQTLDGVTINTYACGGELNGQTGATTGIGTMCHEFSHCLGYPDFYDTDYTGGQGMGAWDLMDSGSYNGDGYRPAGFTGWERWAAGWKTPIELSATQAVTGMKGLQDGGESYIIYNTGNNDEYYMLENRSNSVWDQGVPGYGLLVVHVDYNASSWANNTPNDTPSHQRMTWIPADNQYEYQTYQGVKYYDEDPDDVFPYGTINSFGPNTTPAAKWYNNNASGTKYMEQSILNITKNSSGLISFNFQGLSSVATPSFSPAAGRYSEPQNVTISCATDDVDIYYTLDGSTPSASSTPYTSAITVSETTTIKAVAISVTGEASNVGTAKYTIVDGNQLLYEGVSKYASENDGTAAIETTEADLDYDGWTELTKVYKGGTNNAKENGGCLKLGSSSATGSAKASNIALTGNGTLVFSLKKYGNDTGKLNLTVTGATADVTEFTPTDSWTEYSVNLTGASGNVSITFATTAKRAYVDEIELLASSSTKENVTMSFSPTSVEATLGESFTAPSLTMDPPGFTVNYTSSNTNVATVTSEGAVTLKAAGTTVITAKFNGNDRYNSASANYTLTVKSAGGETGATVDIPYENTLLGSHADFTIEDVATGGLTEVWKDNATYGMTANGYKCTGDIESWLVSPVFNATNVSSPKLIFSHGVNFFTSIDVAKTETGVYIREEGSTTWTALTVDYPEALGNTFLENVSVDLSAWSGKKFQLGFKYTATATKPGRWQLKNLSVVNDGTPVVEAPVLTPSATSATNGEVVTVSASSSDLSSGGGEIWYTTDGSDPKTSTTKSVISDPMANTFNVTMSDADIVIRAVTAVGGGTSFSSETTLTIHHVNSGTHTLPYTEPFNNTTQFGDFTPDANVWSIGSHSGDYYAMGKKQGGVIGWLISPEISLSGATAPVLTWDEAASYMGTATYGISDYATIWIREASAEAGDWVQLVPEYRTNGQGFIWTSIPAVDLSAYTNKTIQIGFKYESTSTEYGTWEIKNFSVSDNAASNVEAPVLTPSATSATEGQSVIVTVSQSGFEGDDGTQIWYTTDGSDPKTSTTKGVLDDSSFNTISVTMADADVVVRAIAVVSEVTGAKAYSAEATVTISYTSSTGKTLPYEADLLTASTGQNDFTRENESIWTWTSNYGAKGTSGSKTDAEGWLISPEISLVGASAPKLTWEEVLKFFGTVDNEATVWIREGETGSWNKLTIATRDDNGNNWNYTSVGENDLSAYIGKTIQIGFKYVSTTAAYGTWEIKNFKVYDGELVITYQDETIASLNGKTGAAIDNIKLNLNNAEVVYVDATQGAYVREGDYAIQFFKTALSLTAGQTMTGSIKFNYSPYYGVPEVKDINGVTNLDDVTFGTTQEPEAKAVTLAELISLNSVADLVKLSNVTIEYVAANSSSVAQDGPMRASTDTYYAVEGSSRVQLFDKFSTGLLTSDLHGEVVTVEGIFGTIYNNAPEVFPTKITTGTTGIDGIENDALTGDDRLYTLDGRRVVGKPTRGIYVRNGKKFVVK